MTFKKQFHSTFGLVFMTFAHLNHVVTLRTLSSLYIINGLEEGFAHLLEILTSTYGIKFKLRSVIALDKGRRYMTFSLWSRI